MMTCIIIEDQPPAQRILKKYIEDLGTLELKATFPDAIAAMEFLRSSPVDLLFLDIHLPKISGIDFLKSMPETPQVILTTAFSDYALESYEFNVADYLLKPFSFQRFVKAVTKVTQKNIAEHKAQEKSPETTGEVFIKSGYELVKISIDAIIYIKSDTDYTEIFLTEKKHLSSEPLRYWEETLAEHHFVRVHKSYLINASKIEKLSGSQLYLANETVIPIGRVYKDMLMEKIKRNQL